MPLPSARQVRADFSRMVGFGPRLTGSPQHAAYIDWLKEEFTAAGLQLLPDAPYRTNRWTVGRYGLDLPDGPVKVATYYPRSQETPGGGVEGPLVYAGTDPLSNLGALQGTQGSILLVELPMPAPAKGAIFLPDSTFRYWPGHTDADWATADYTRLWIEPGLGVPLQPFQALGAAGVVFILDASYEALAGGYLPFTHGLEPLPALYVDRDTGAQLRAHAQSRPRARLTLTATRKSVPVDSVTAVLPGASDQAIVFNTHTDGQGFVEENGGVAFVHLARHFASLRPSRRLRRTLVFAAWPGHMTYDLPQTQGWIDAHADLVKRAAAALTVEHLGCTEWTDAGGPYRPTGEPEMFAIWTTQGKLFELVRDSVVAHDLRRTSLMRPPVQFGVGAAFQSAGVPQIGAIAGPEYLLTVSGNGDLDKLDAGLAARQIAWLADLARQIDGVPAADLRGGDPTLGVPA